MQKLPILSANESQRKNRKLRKNSTTNGTENGKTFEFRQKLITRRRYRLKSRNERKRDETIELT